MSVAVETPRQVRKIQVDVAAGQVDIRPESPVPVGVVEKAERVPDRLLAAEFDPAVDDRKRVVLRQRQAPVAVQPVLVLLVEQSADGQHPPPVYLDRVDVVVTVLDRSGGGPDESPGGGVGGHVRGGERVDNCPLARPDQTAGGEPPAHLACRCTRGDRSRVPPDQAAGRELAVDPRVGGAVLDSPAVGTDETAGAELGRDTPLNRAVPDCPGALPRDGTCLALELTDGALQVDSRQREVLDGPRTDTGKQAGSDPLGTVAHQPRYLVVVPVETPGEQGPLDTVPGDALQFAERVPADLYRVGRRVGHHRVGVGELRGFLPLDDPGGRVDEIDLVVCLGDLGNPGLPEFGPLAGLDRAGAEPLGKLRPGHVDVLVVAGRLAVQVGDQHVLTT